MQTGRRACTGLLASSCLAAAIASAPPVGAQDKAAEAHARFKEGVSAYERGEYERARVLFLQSAALVARGSVLRNLALAELELGRPVEALHHLRAALATRDLDAKRRSVAENDLRDAYAATAHVKIETTPGASVRIDDEALAGTAPFAEPVDLMPGKHVIVGTLGDRSARAEPDLPAGTVESVSLVLEPTPPAATMPAEQATKVPPASSEVAADRPLAVPSQEPIGTTSDAIATARPSFWTARRQIGMATLLAGVASTIGGVYFYAQANDERDRAQAARTQIAHPSDCRGSMTSSGCAELQGAFDAQRTDMVLNYVFVGVGAAGMALGATLLLWPGRSASPVAFEPAITPRGGGLRLRGAF
ncbi:MAG: hypothetical protein JOZ69_01165 [Myxococcales bacterium]|nr:hypothetical protein [Myxococcales bacterium]